MESEIIEKEIYNTNLVSELNAEIDQLKKILNDSKKELVIYQNQARYHKIFQQMKLQIVNLTLNV